MDEQRPADEASGDEPRRTDLDVPDPTQGLGLLTDVPDERLGDALRAEPDVEDATPQRDDG